MASLINRFHSIEDLRFAIVQLGCADRSTRGVWTIGQIYYHLAAAFEGSVDGLPPGYTSLTRLLVRPLRLFVTRVRFPPWLPIPRAIASKLEPPRDADCEQQYARLLKAIDRFTSHAEAFPPHPVLGPLSRSEWTGFHLRHCQHHLAFIETQA